MWHWLGVVVGVGLGVRLGAVVGVGLADNLTPKYKS